MKLASRRSADAPSTARSGRLRSTALIALAVVVVLALDRLTKQAVESAVKPGEERSFLPGIQIVHTHNDGVAFGLLGGSQVYLTVALALVVVLALMLFASRVERIPTRPIWLPVGMVIGGALGNVIDRLRLGFVTDFVKLPLGWPPFNLADASITLGVLLLALLIGRGSAREQG